MKVTLIAPHELGPGERARWRRLQQAHPGLASPFFAPEFTLAAGSCRPGVRVAVLEDAGEVTGFFPFEHSYGMGRPAGGRFSDHHGVIAAPAADGSHGWNWQDLLRATGLSWWRFDHLAAWQRPPGDIVQAVSPGLDLSRGFHAWFTGRVQASGRIAALPRKLRKLGREVGPVRFVADCRDPAAFREVLRLKSRQCVLTGEADIFGPGWARELVERVRATVSDDFGGRVSALYAGDTLVAAHFGMRSRQVWHWWLPVYSAAHRAYSPGAQLLLALAGEAARSGHDLLDLGKGPEPYKAEFADCELPVVAGVVSRPTALTATRAFKHSAAAWLQRLRPSARCAA